MIVTAGASVRHDFAGVVDLQKSHGAAQIRMTYMQKLVTVEGEVTYKARNRPCHSHTLPPAAPVEHAMFVCTRLPQRVLAGGFTMSQVTCRWAS